MPARPVSRTPQVSLLMVVRNGAVHIDAALGSARRQSLTDIEILVVDDGSTDSTCEIVRRHAAADPRVRLEAGPRLGLAAIRNRSLELARAPWAAILDSDDILHPRHVERLLALALRRGAPLAAANMITFGAREAELFASGSPWASERIIDRTTFVHAGRLDQPGISLGYLKPLMRREALAAHGLRYDVRLRIGEDYDLVERALAQGLTYVFSPEPTYFYRRHAASTSHRLGRADLTALIAAEDERADAEQFGPLAEARAARRRSLATALAHVELVADLKAGRIGPALGRMLRVPAAARLLAASAREGMVRRLDARRLARSPSGPGGARWSALLCGAPQPGSPAERAARLLARQGCDLRWIEDAVAADPVALARAGRGVSLVLLADQRQCEAAAFAIADGAPVVADRSIVHPLIDMALDPARPEELLSIVCGPPLDALPRSVRPELAA